MSESKKILVIGASTNRNRYSYKATERLKAHGHNVVLLGNRHGEIFGEKIETEKRTFKDIDTVTLYIGAKIQPDYYDYIVSLKPKRVIFNPGTENPEFEKLLQKNNIEAIEACTLVMLSIGNF